MARMEYETGEYLLAGPIFYRNYRMVLLCLTMLVWCTCISKRVEASPKPVQFPSPMVDHIRAHKRLANSDLPGQSIMLKDILARPVEVYRPNQKQTQQCDLLLHFHGASYVPKYAVHRSKHPLILAVIHLGSGSSVYETAFQEESAFPTLLKRIRESVSAGASSASKDTRVYLSSFSAGYGAVRAILRQHASAVQGIVLLDGLHTDYVPSRRVLAQGGSLNTEKLEGFVRFARRAIGGEKTLLVTHSEIFPGTYASTTETADFLIDTLGLKRCPVLKWGPVGMQMLSETRAQGLSILGFAGNTAPDHIDHFHGLPKFLDFILPEQADKTAMQPD